MLFFFSNSSLEYYWSTTQKPDLNGPVSTYLLAVAVLTVLVEALSLGRRSAGVIQCLETTPPGAVAAGGEDSWEEGSEEQPLPTPQPDNLPNKACFLPAGNGVRTKRDKCLTKVHHITVREKVLKHKKINLSWILACDLLNVWYCSQIIYKNWRANQAL